MAELPPHPRTAHLLLRGQALGLGNLACDFAAMLGDKDILRGAGADLHDRITAIGHESSSRASRGAVQRVRQLARQFRGYLQGAASEPVADPNHQRWLGVLLAFAYPDRVAIQRRDGGGNYRLANGRAAQFGEPDALMKEPWLVIADLGSRQGQREERIYLAAALDASLFDTALAEQVSQRDELEWDEREGVLKAERQRRVGELVLSRTALPGLDEIAGGRQGVLLHLLSPARRPVQVTQDLASFWANTYLEVKKDLKGRYPEHWWPDNPMEAKPTARAKPRH